MVTVGKVPTVTVTMTFISFFVITALEMMKDQGSRSSRSSLSGPDMTVQYLQGLGICYNFSIYCICLVYSVLSVFSG